MTPAPPGPDPAAPLAQTEPKGTPMAPIRRPALRSGLAAALGLALLAAPARAGETVTFRFEPPQVEAQPICAVRAPDADLLARWEAWDGQSLQGLDPGVVQREMRRLRELDAVRWYDRIDAAIRLLPPSAPASPKTRPRWNGSS